jgi:dolichol kinase
MEEPGQISIGGEFVRKGIHLFALVIPVGYYFIGNPLSIIILGIAAVTAILIDVARLRRWQSWQPVIELLRPIIRRHEVAGGFTGASYILTTAVIVILIFDKSVAIAALVFVIIGDAAAAIIGRMIGRHRLIGKKTIEGSLACLGFLIGVSILIPGMPAVPGILGAITATLAEAFSGRIDDNLAVPLLSGLVMQLAIRAGF